VVSMGDVAGSGGYYVACAADTIFADATTLTGSIGVLSGKLATTEMWKKIGITFKEYKRGQNAGLLSTDDIFTESERARMRAYMDEVYATFKQHVTGIRGQRLKKPLDELAGGRVYTGKQALELGLVDRLGTLSDAIAFAAGQAKIKDYDVRVVPEPRSFMEQLMEQISGGKSAEHGIGAAGHRAGRAGEAETAFPRQGADAGAGDPRGPARRLGLAPRGEIKAPVERCRQGRDHGGGTSRGR